MPTDRQLAIQWYTEKLSAAAERGASHLYEAKRWLAKNDLFYLMVAVIGRRDLNCDWLFARCREVQTNPDGHLDLWAREHYKSTIITFGLTIQDVLNDPEVTVGIFSHTRPIAKGFLRQIKREFETNETLRGLFPDLFWENERRDAPKWSEDDGLIVRRKTNPKESTIEAWGLVDGQPTSKHFKRLIFDDVVTQASVTTPDMIKKTTDAWELSLNLGAAGGSYRGIGTRYHYSDTYKTIVDRGSMKPRVYPATINGKVDGEPVLLSREVLAEKRRDMGPYTFGCFVAGTSVLMSDWSQRPIESVAVGDGVVGYIFGDGQRARLAKTRVLARQSRMMPVVRFVFESGRSITGTRDHKFWHGRAGRSYSPLGLKYGELRAACSVFDPRAVNAPFPERAGGYVAGVFDGEGSVSGGTVHIAQSANINPGVCERIERALVDCGVSFNTTESAKRPGHRDYYVTGGRQGLIRFLNVIGQAGKAQRLADRLFESGTRNIGKGARDKLAAIEDCGLAEVFNIQTESGNYVAEGYAVKNCQMLQDPKADETQGFKDEWLAFWPAHHAQNLNVYIIVDPASEKKKSSDYTVMTVLGVGDDDCTRVITWVRDRLSLTEKADYLFNLHREYRPLGVGYEQYGMQADIAHFEDRMKRENYKFQITPLGGQVSKPDRIRSLIPQFEQGRILLPEHCMRRNYEGITEDLTKVFLDDEYRAFPVASHDDMLDCLARINDPDFTMARPGRVRRSTAMPVRANNNYSPHHHRRIV